MVLVVFTTIKTPCSLARTHKTHCKRHSNRPPWPRTICTQSPMASTAQEWPDDLRLRGFPCAMLVRVCVHSLLVARMLNSSGLLKPGHHRFGGTTSHSQPTNLDSGVFRCSGSVPLVTTTTTTPTSSRWMASFAELSRQTHTHTKQFEHLLSVQPTKSPLKPDAPIRAVSQNKRENLYENTNKKNLQ